MMIRRFETQDVAGCHVCFRDAILNGASDHYHLAQRTAWAGPTELPASWADRLGGSITFVAEANGIQGFMNLTPKGMLDLAYIRPDQRRTGLAGRLYNACFGAEEARHIIRASCDASHYMRGFLQKRGWHIRAEQVVIRDGVEIENCRMAKTLR